MLSKIDVKANSGGKRPKKMDRVDGLDLAASNSGVTFPKKRTKQSLQIDDPDLAADYDSRESNSGVNIPKQKRSESVPADGTDLGASTSKASLPKKPRIEYVRLDDPNFASKIEQMLREIEEDEEEIDIPIDDSDEDPDYDMDDVLEVHSGSEEEDGKIDDDLPSVIVDPRDLQNQGDIPERETWFQVEYSRTSKNHMNTTT